MPSNTSDTKSKSQLDADIDDALREAGGEGAVGYWPGLPVESPAPAPRRRRPTRARTRAPAKTRTRRARGSSTRKKTRARPARKKTARKASSPKPRATSSRRSTTRKAKAKTSRAKKTRKAKKSRARPRARSVSHASAPGSTSATELLSAVLAAVHGMPRSGRFGDSKVFIYPLWQRVGKRFKISLDEFKRWLVNQNRMQNLDLSRADLVDAMNPTLVSRSEINDLGSSFHFVVDRSAKNPW